MWGRECQNGKDKRDRKVKWGKENGAERERGKEGGVGRNVEGRGRGRGRRREGKGNGENEMESG